MTATELPSELLKNCSLQQIAEVQRWWQGLGAISQTEVRILLDRRGDSCAYLWHRETADSPYQWRRLPWVDDGLPVESDGEELPSVELLQEVLDRDHLTIPVEATVRTFRICQAHPKARAVSQSHYLPATFRCPFAAKNCLLEQTASEQGGAKLLLRDQKNRGVWLCDGKGSMEGA